MPVQGDFLRLPQPPTWALTPPEGGGGGKVGRGAPRRWAGLARGPKGVTRRFGALAHPGLVLCVCPSLRRSLRLV